MYNQYQNFISTCVVLIKDQRQQTDNDQINKWTINNNKTNNQEKITHIDKNKLEAAAMAENFIKTDEKLCEDGKRRFNFMLGRHSHHWECAQQAWILSLVLSEQISSSRRWIASLIAKTWLTSWDMGWEQRNCILSYVNLTMTEMMTFTDNSRISQSRDKNFSEANLPTSFSIIGNKSSSFSL